MGIGDWELNWLVKWYPRSCKMSAYRIIVDGYRHKGKHLNCLLNHSYLQMT